MSEQYQYKFEINRIRKKSTVFDDRVFIGPIDFKSSFEDDPKMIGPNGLTGLGYKVIVKSLSEAIVQQAKLAAQKGFSEGEIIGDAVELILSSFIDPTKKAPEITRNGSFGNNLK